MFTFSTAAAQFRDYRNYRDLIIVFNPAKRAKQTTQHEIIKERGETVRWGQCDQKKNHQMSIKDCPKVISLEK